MDTIAFLKKYQPNQSEMAYLLNISTQSYHNKLHGTGKSRPFSQDQIDVLNQYIVSIATDIEALRTTLMARLQEKLEAYCQHSGATLTTTH